MITQSYKNKHPFAERKQVVELHKSGLGSKRIAKIMGIDSSTIRLWLRRYRKYGDESLQPYWRDTRQKTDEKAAVLHQEYEEAVRLYKESRFSRRKISEELGLAYYKFNNYMNTYHRDLIEQRRAARTSGSTAKRSHKDAREKFADAVRACDSARYIEFSIGQIARFYDLGSTSLASHLRLYHPEILIRREELRHVLGTRAKDGALSAVAKAPSSTEASMFKDAVDFLKGHNEAKVAEVANRYGHDVEQLRDFIRIYRPDVIVRRNAAKQANNQDKHAVRKYDDAIRLYAETPENLKSISRRLGLPYNSLGSFIRRNHPDVITRHNIIAQQRMAAAHF